MTFGFIVALLSCVQTGAPKVDSKAITPEAAIKQVGKSEVLVEIVVKTAKDRLERRGIVYLDSEDDFKKENNLGVAISASAAEKLKKKGITDIERHFQGKTIQVRGCVMRFEDRPYLPVLDPDQIKIVEKK